MSQHGTNGDKSIQTYDPTSAMPTSTIPTSVAPTFVAPTSVMLSSGVPSSTMPISEVPSSAIPLRGGYVNSTGGRKLDRSMRWLCCKNDDALSTIICHREEVLKVRNTCSSSSH